MRKAACFIHVFTNIFKYWYVFLCYNIVMNSKYYVVGCILGSVFVSWLVRYFSYQKESPKARTIISLHFTFLLDPILGHSSFHNIPTSPTSNLHAASLHFIIVRHIHVSLLPLVRYWVVSW